MQRYVKCFIWANFGDFPVSLRVADCVQEDSRRWKNKVGFWEKCAALKKNKVRPCLGRKLACVWGADGINEHMPPAISAGGMWVTRFETVLFFRRTTHQRYVNKGFGMGGIVGGDENTPAAFGTFQEPCVNGDFQFGALAGFERGSGNFGRDAGVHHLERLYFERRASGVGNDNLSFGLFVGGRVFQFQLLGADGEYGRIGCQIGGLRFEVGQEDG